MSHFQVNTDDYTQMIQLYINVLVGLCTLHRVTIDRVTIDVVLSPTTSLSTMRFRLSMLRELLKTRYSTEGVDKLVNHVCTIYGLRFVDVHYASFDSVLSVFNINHV